MHICDSPRYVNWESSCISLRTSHGTVRSTVQQRLNSESIYCPRWRPRQCRITSPDPCPLHRLASSSLKKRMRAFYLRKLTGAECSYDIGNWELLAVKVVLEEWCHWLERARHPFTMFTDHRQANISSRQNGWTLDRRTGPCFLLTSISQ